MCLIQFEGMNSLNSNDVKDEASSETKLSGKPCLLVLNMERKVDYLEPVGRQVRKVDSVEPAGTFDYFTFYVFRKCVNHNDTTDHVPGVHTFFLLPHTSFQLSTL